MIGKPSKALYQVKLASGISGSLVLLGMVQVALDMDTIETRAALWGLDVRDKLLPLLTAVTKLLSRSNVIFFNKCKWVFNI